MADNETTQDKNIFEIGLVLAGAVSAGAYSAGVIDFLIEALDKWYTAKESEAGVPLEKRLVPSHDVCLRAMSGSSAGSMVAARLPSCLTKLPALSTLPVRPKKAPSPTSFTRAG